MTVPPAIRELLRPSPDGPTLVVALGNPLRADDGAGPWIAARAAPPRGVAVWDAGDRPEEIPDRAAALGARRVVVVDAADFGGAPGEIRLLEAGSLAHVALSTHTFPIAAIARLVEVDQGCPVSFVGIQAVSARPGEGLSPEVEGAARAVVEALSGP
jgi:hydrogenase 3 maturation protease